MSGEERAKRIYSYLEKKYKAPNHEGLAHTSILDSEKERKKVNGGPLAKELVKDSRFP